MQETQVRSLGQEDPLEEGMATFFRILAWRIPRTEEPGRLVPGVAELDTTEGRNSSNSSESGDCPWGERWRWIEAKGGVADGRGEGDSWVRAAARELGSGLRRGWGESALFHPLWGPRGEPGPESCPRQAILHRFVLEGYELGTSGLSQAGSRPHLVADAASLVPDERSQQSLWGGGDMLQRVLGSGNWPSVRLYHCLQSQGNGFEHHWPPPEILFYS